MDMKNELENYIRSHRDQLDNKKPDAAVLGRILNDLKRAGNETPKGIVISFRFLKWAAAGILIIMGSLIGWWVNQQPPAKGIVQNSIPEQPALPPLPTDSVLQHIINRAGQKIAGHTKANERNSKEKTNILFRRLYNMPSAAGRISAVAVVSRLSHNDHTLIEALLHLLDTDPNTSVRLAALDGLSRYYELPPVKSRLLASLKKQHDPVLQVSLISLLTQVRELRVLPSLEQLVRDDHTNQTVKDLAWSGIQKLRPEMID
jgi:hypothetical protein